MEPVIKRLGQYLMYKGLNQSGFATALGYSSSEKISRLFRIEGAKPSYDIIHDIANKFEDLNIEWWITGKGSMIKESDKHRVNFLLFTEKNKTFVLHRFYPAFLAEIKQLKPFTIDILNSYDNIPEQELLTLSIISEMKAFYKEQIKMK